MMRKYLSNLGSRTALGGGKRQSNIELLRLLSMLMVLNLHSFWGYDHNHGSIAFQAIDLIRESTSICAVDTFILISGYFGIKWKLQSFFNLVFQLFFYSFLVYVVVVLFGIIKYSASDFVDCFKALYNSWGFITWYIILYFMSPLLNAFSEKASNRDLLLFIVVLFIGENFIFMTQGALNFCLLYLIGRLINKIEVTERLKFNSNLFYWLVTIIIFIVIFILYVKLHWGYGLFLAFGYSSPLVILQACFLFITFCKLKFENKFINWCAASCLSIFLIHMHPAIKEIGYYRYTESLYSLPIVEHTWKLTLLMLVVFFGSILVDKIRILISSIVYKCLLWIISKLRLSNTNIDSYIPNIVNHGRL